MSIAKKVQENMVSGFGVRKIYEDGLALKKQYGEENVFDLSMGNPVLEPPEAFIKEMLKLALEPTLGMHRYMPNAGYPETRDAVAKQLSFATGIAFSGEEIFMTSGTIASLNITFRALINPGEEIIAFAPYFFEYDAFLDNFDGIIKVCPSDENFIPKFDLFEASINPKTKAVIINSPNNPSGVVYSDQVLIRLSEIIRKKAKEYGDQIFVISDDVYTRIIYDGVKCPRILPHYSDTIVVSSFSKDLSLPGERIGYTAVHPDCENAKEVVNALVYSNRAIYTCAPALQQHLVTNIQDVSISMAQYQKNRDCLYDNLTKMGYSVVKPGGAFYMFPRTLPGMDDLTFANELKQFRVLVVPGINFRSPGHFRIAYCMNDRIIEGCLDGFRKVAQKYIK
jgi:aspartate aminotransferase